MTGTTNDPRPWPVELLADLHAGGLDDAEAAQLWPQVRADAHAMAVIDALEATTAELAGMRAAPVSPVPETVAARLEAAVPGPTGPAAVPPVREGSPARGHYPGRAWRRRARPQRARTRDRVAAAAVAGVAAAVLAVAVVVAPDATTAGTPSAAGPAERDAAVLPPDEPAERALGAALGVVDYGPLSDEETLQACLRDYAVAMPHTPAGVRPATVAGQEAVLVVLTTGEFARFRIVAVPAGCDGPLLYDEVTE